MLKFRQTLLQFYSKGIGKRDLGELYAQALERFLVSAEANGEVSGGQEQQGQGKRSLKSNNSASSAGGASGVTRAFHSECLATAVVFTYFLQVLQSGKADKLSMVLRTASDSLRKYDRQIKVDARRTFLSRIAAFSEEISHLGLKAEQGCAIQWLFYSAFSNFESQAPLFSQILSSFGEGLETLEKMRENDYCNLLAALNVSCSILDEGKRAVKELGSGDIKLYLTSRPQGFFMSSQGHQATLQTTKRGEGKSMGASQQRASPDKKKPQQKFKAEFLEQLLKLRQQFEENTTKVAGLLTFKDRDSWQQQDDDVI